MRRGEQLRRSLRHLKRLLLYEAGVLGTAWMYFTRVPLPPALVHAIQKRQHSFEECARYLPVVGIFIGAIAGSVFLGANELFGNKPIAIILSLLSSLIVSGATGEQGLAGFFDAFGSGRLTKQRVLGILWDAHTGVYGVLAIVIVLLLKYQALLLIPNELIPSVLIAAHAFSRFAAGSFIFTHAYVQRNDSQTQPALSTPMQTRDFIIMAFLGMVPLMIVGSLLFLLLVPLLWVMRNLFGAWFIRKIHGYTDECLGAAQQIVETSCYLLIVISFKYAIEIG